MDSIINIQSSIECNSKHRLSVANCRNDRLIEDARPTISLATLIDFSLQRTYHEMMVLSELLPRKNDFERKLEILQFAEKARRCFVRLLGVIKWVHNQEQIEKCDGILSFLENQKYIFIDTADYLAKMARETLVQARLPKYAIQEAANVLVDGTYPFIPLCVKKKILPPSLLTTEEKILVMNRLEMAIRSRIALEGLPPFVKIENIEHGSVTLCIPQQFRVTMTLMMDKDKENNDNSEQKNPEEKNIMADLKTTWRLLKLEILVGINNASSKDNLINNAIGTGISIHPAQVEYIHNILQLKLLSPSIGSKASVKKEEVPLSPLWELYQFLRTFCLGLRLEAMYTQLATAIQDVQIDPSIRILNYVPGQELSLAYYCTHYAAPMPPNCPANLNRLWWEVVSKGQESKQISSGPALVNSSSQYPLVYSLSVGLAGPACETDGDLIVKHKPDSLLSVWEKRLQPSSTSSPNLDHTLPLTLSGLNLDGCSEIETLINTTLRIRASQKLSILKAEWSPCFQAVKDSETEHSSLLQLMPDFCGFPCLKVRLSERFREKDSLIVTVDASTGLFKLQLPKYPDIKGQLVPILESVLNTTFDCFVKQSLTQNNILETNTETRADHKAQLKLGKVLCGIVGATKLYITLQKLVRTLARVPFVKVGKCFKPSTIAALFLQNLSTQPTKTKTLPLPNSSFKTADQIKREKGVDESLSTTLDFGGAPPSLALSDKSETGSQKVPFPSEQPHKPKDQEKTLLSLFFTKFKDSKMTIKYREIDGKDSNESCTQRVIPSYQLAFYFATTESRARPSLLDWLKGENNPNKPATQTSAIGPLKCLTTNGNPDPGKTLSHLVSQFECLVPLCKLSNALSSTQPRQYRKKDVKDANNACIDSCTILTDLSLGSKARATTQSQLPSECALNLSFFTDDKSIGDFDSRRTKLIVKESYAPHNEDKRWIHYYSSYYVCRVTLTLQGKTSRYWFATVELIPRRYGTVMEDPWLKTESEISTTITLRRFVYFQYFSIPTFKYTEVAEAFWRDLDLINRFGAHGDLFITPSPLANNRVLRLNNLVYYNYKRLTLAYGPNGTYYVTLHWNHELNCYKLTFTRPTYVMNTITSSSRSISLTDYDNRDKGKCSLRFGPNPHNAVKSSIEMEFNRELKNGCHKSIFWLLEVLDRSIRTLEIIPRFPNTPFLGSFNKYIESIAAQTFTIIPLSVSHIRLIYRKTFCVDFEIFGNGSVVSVKDCYWAVKDILPQNNSTHHTHSETFSLLPYLKEFIRAHSSKLKVKNEVEAMDLDIDSRNIKQEPMVLAQGEIAEPAGVSSIVTLGNLDLDSLLGETNVMPGNEEFDRTTSSTPQIIDVFQPNDTLSTNTTTFFESVPALMENPTEFSGLGNQLSSRPAELPVMTNEQSREDMIRYYFEVFKKEYWLDFQDFASLSSIYQHSTSHPLNYLEKYLGCVYVLKHLTKIVQNEENLLVLGVVDAGAITFQANCIQCQVSLDLNARCEDLKITFYAVPQQQSQDFFITEYDAQTLDTFFKTKVACPPYRINAIVSFCRILAAPPRILKDILEIMRLETLSSQATPPDPQATIFKWSLHWCLTIPPSGPVLAPVGTPAVVIKNKMLFFVEIRRQYNQMTGSTTSFAQTNIPYCLVIPLVHDLNNNTTQLADPRAPNAPAQSVSNPAFTTISNLFKRFAEYHMNPKECTLYPAVRELITNLVLPTNL